MSEGIDKRPYASLMRDSDSMDYNPYHQRPSGFTILSYLFFLLGGIIAGLGLIGLMNSNSLRSQGWSSQHASTVFYNNLWILIAGIIIILYIYPLYEMKSWGWKYFKVVNTFLFLVMIIYFTNATLEELDLMTRYNLPISSLYSGFLIMFIFFAIFGALFYYIYSKRELFVN